jgi:hypothetical protein
MHDKIVFDQINLHHCKEATSVLRRSLDSMQTNIALIQEPHFFKGKVIGLGSSGTLHCIFSEQLVTRACIYTSKFVNATLLRQFSNTDFVAILIRYRRAGVECSFICCSAYLPYETIVPTKELVDITRHCTSNGIKLLLGCDANSHHFLWGSSDINSRGNKLMEFIASYNLVILNKGNRPTFVNSIREEVIDVTLCTSSVEFDIDNWHVVQEDSLSDHQTIRFSITGDPDIPTSYRNAKSTNWSSFQKLFLWRMGSWDRDVSNVFALDEAVSDLTNCLVWSFEESCPLKVVSGRKITPWYNHELRNLKIANNRAWNNRRPTETTVLPV